MDLLFVVIAGSVGVYALIKGEIKVSKTKEISGKPARILGLIYIASSAAIVLLEFADFNETTFAAYLLGLVVVLLVVSSAFIFLFSGQKEEHISEREGGITTR